MIAERFHFHRRNQSANETIAEYIAALRQAALYCQYDAFLDQALRDRFVGGLRTEAMQKRLLDLTLTNAVKLVQGMESADRNTRSFKGNDPAIHALHGRNGTGGRKQCYRCGKTGHMPSDCRFKEAECHACGKKGHIAPAYRSTPKSHTNDKPHLKKHPKKHGTNRVQEEQEDS